MLAPASLAKPARTVHFAPLGQVLTRNDMTPPITWLVVYNLNPVVTLPNQNLIIEGLMHEDLFTVVHEQFMTDTALCRHRLAGHYAVRTLGIDGLLGPDLSGLESARYRAARRSGGQQRIVPSPVALAAARAALPLRLISAKTSHFLNSGYVNLPHAGTRKHRPEIQINPRDAAARAIAGGDRVRMFNALGAVEAIARGRTIPPPAWSTWPSTGGRRSRSMVLQPMP